MGTNGAGLYDREDNLLRIPWLINLVNKIEELPYVERAFIIDPTSRSPDAEFGVCIEVSQDKSIEEITPAIAEFITSEFWDEYERTGSMPVLYWEVKFLAPGH
ncbi:hypothetical protein [Hydrogenivirga sp.]